jgi:hypothetical protein
MNAVGRHAVLSAIALLLGAALVMWVRPETPAGVVLLVVVMVAVINAIGAVVWRAPKITWIGLAPFLFGASQCADIQNTPGGGLVFTPGAILTPTRAFLRAQDIPPRGVGAYGVVAFRALPTTSSRTRLLRVCQSFLASLPPQTSLPRSIPVADQMVTVWPLITPHGTEAELIHCDYLIDNYDLYGGLSAIQDARSQEHPLTGRGPFLSRRSRNQTG